MALRNTTSSATHTAGPWYQTSYLVREKAKAQIVADCSEREYQPDYKGHRIGIEECKANARLIAAAPELLDCCKMLLQVLMRDSNDEDDSFGSEISHAEGVIAAAEGRA